MLRKLKTKERCKKNYHACAPGSRKEQGPLILATLLYSLDKFHFMFNTSPVCVFCFTISSSLKHAALTKFEQALRKWKTLRVILEASQNYARPPVMKINWCTTQGEF